MAETVSARRALLFVLAMLFAAATLLYTASWIYYIRQPTRAELGMFLKYCIASRRIEIVRLMEGGNVERAGLRPGDMILAINGRPLDTLSPYYDLVDRGRPGDVVKLTVLRAGEGSLEVFPLALDPPRGMRLTLGLTPTRTAALQVMLLYPLSFLVVGLAVLFLRLNDRNAWLLALLFGGFIAAPGIPDGVIPPGLRGFAMAYRVVLGSITPALFYGFFAVFPAPSPLERRAPWLKWVVGLAGLALLGVTLRSLVLAHTSGPLWMQIEHFQARWMTASVYGLAIGYSVLGQVLGLVSLVLNSLYGTTAEVRRKARVIVWGVVGGLLPMFLLVLGVVLYRGGFEEIPFWPWAVAVVALFLLPLSFAYAVVKHRVLEIPVLLRRSARYVLVQRGFVFLILLTSGIATAFFAVMASRLFESGAQVAVPAGLTAGVGFGLVLAIAGSRIYQQVSQRIDQAFFRSAYDARQILLELVDETRRAADRRQLALLLERQLTTALHPTSLAIYFETGPGILGRQGGDDESGLAAIAADLPELIELGRRGKPSDSPPRPGEGDLFSILTPLHPECLVPVLGRDRRLIGLLALGPRLSEEPYSGEDKGLLASVASQAGIALDNIRLAQQMAERMEAERRAALEMQIAKQVQAQLFPQKRPPLATLEYLGGCVQARDVGGDYYDFLNLGAGRVGLVLADISGKGISAALLMANLQANLRSQYALALKDLPGLLGSVNRLFCESTPPGLYATLFFADYDDSTCLLRYVNCGHNPPVLLRDDGSVERLQATATVLGLFERWESSSAEVRLNPGDLLVIFSDGATDAESDGGEQFGETRLIETLSACRHLPVSEVLETVVRTIQSFSGREREDDLTFVVARAR